MNDEEADILAALGSSRGQIESVSEATDSTVDLKRSRRRKAASADARIDRLPPHAPEAEQGVLGCVLLAPNDCLGQCIERFGSDREPFYDLRHQTVWECLVWMFENRQPIDIITVQQRLKDRSLLDQVGGIPYLNALQESVPSAANLSYYLDFVCEKSLLRKIIRHGTDMVARVYDFSGEVDELVDEIERNALALRGTATNRDSKADIRALQVELMADYEAGRTRSAPVGLLTGFQDIDRRCGGMMGQELIIIAGNPSTGKTTLALNIAYRVARSGNKVSMISMETSAKKLVHRLHSLAGQVEGGKFLRGQVEDSDFEEMSRGVVNVREISENLLIHDSGAMSEGKLLSICRKDYQEGSRLFIVDYLQLLQARGDSETEKTTNASKCLKGLAAELNCPVIAIASLRRQEVGKVRRPQMSDLRQSGQIEYDAEKIMLLYCEDVTVPIREVECNIAKNKDGPLDTVKLTMFSGQFRMETASAVSDEDVPRSQHANE